MPRRKERSRRGKKAPPLDLLKPELSSSSFGASWVSPPCSPTTCDCNEQSKAREADFLDSSISTRSRSLLSPGSSSASELESRSSGGRRRRRGRKGKKASLDVLEPELSSSSFGAGWVSPRSSMNFDSIIEAELKQATAELQSSLSSSSLVLSESSSSFEFDGSSRQIRKNGARDEKASSLNVIQPELFCSSFGPGWASSSSSSISYDYYNQDADGEETVDLDSSISTRSSLMYTDSEVETSSRRSSSARKKRSLKKERQQTVRFAAEVNLRRKCIRDTLLEAQRPTRPRHRTLSTPPSILRQQPEPEVPQGVADVEESDNLDWTPRSPTLLLY